MKTFAQISRRKQSGAVLVITLIMAMIIAIIGISTIDSTNVNKILIENQSNQLHAEMIANNVVELVLSDVNNFIDPSFSYSTSIDGRTAEVRNIRCVRSKAADGYSLSSSVAPEVLYWTFDVSVSDPVTGATVVLTQGTKFNYPTGNCT